MAYAGPVPFPVIEGGTGDASFTAYSVIAGGTTSTGALQNVSGVGTTGQVLTSNGAAALPTWQAAGGGPGAAKAWGVFTTDGSGNYSSILSSFNVTSVSGSGGNPYTVTLTNPFVNTNFAIIAMNNTGTQNTVPDAVSTSSSTATISFGVQVIVLSGQVSFACFGT